jgi:protein-S-isoprenylcysteine O-methyltransferase Ste14
LIIIDDIWNDLTYRIILLVLLAFFGLIRGYYSHKAKAVDPDFYKRRHRKDTRIYERRLDVAIQDLVAIAWFIPMILYLLIPSWRAWATFPIWIFLWLRWIGVGVAAFSLLLLVWVHRVLGEFWTATLELKKDHKLITRGPYGRIRHPMYTASLIFMLATGLIAVDWVILLATLLTLIVLYRRTNNEERMMLDHFGNEYRKYMQHTRRFLPRIHWKHIDARA